MQVGYEKISRFLINISLYLGNDTRQGHSYYGTPKGTPVIYGIGGAIYNDLE